MSDSQSARTFALVGPGRAGTSLALLLVRHGWRAVGVAGRAPDAPGTVAVGERLGAPARETFGVARGAELVVVATPDAVVDEAAAALVPSLDPGTLVAPPVRRAGTRRARARGPAPTGLPDRRAAPAADAPVRGCRPGPPPGLVGRGRRSAGGLGARRGARPASLPGRRRRSCAVPRRRDRGIEPSRRAARSGRTPHPHGRHPVRRLRSLGARRHSTTRSRSDRPPR